MPLTLSPDALFPLFSRDAELGYKLNGFTGRFRVTVDSDSVDLHVAAGSITSVTDADGDALIELSIPGSVLDGGSKPHPDRGTEAAFTGQALGIQMIGDFQTAIAPYAGAISRVYDLLRRSNGGVEILLPADDPLFKDTDTAVGRYVYVTIAGVEYRVYYEQAGSGDEVLLLQHTAGADARQWRNQLADPELQRRFTIIAYDLPYHGRSLPPTSQRWWEHPYLPTKEWLLEAVVAIVDTLAIEKPIFLGCSVGGQLALDLAAHHHDKFKAFLSLNGTLDNAAADDPFMIAWNDLCRDNRISTEAYSTGNFNATSPLAPEAYRRELYWLYRSNFPGVYAGDNDYFMVGHDLKIDGHLMRPDKTPVYALAGEYDPVSWMEDHGGPAVAREFPGVIYRELKGIGHFAPTDTPIEFRNAMLPIFDEVLERVRSGRTATV